MTVGARRACLSRFYKFLIRMEIVASNPCIALEQLAKAHQSPLKGLSADEIRRLLDVIPAMPSGLRDRAIVLTLALTGRRRTEVLSLQRGDLSGDDGAVYYSYRGKGGKKVKREPPRPALEAIEEALAAWGKSLATMAPGESLWRQTRSELLLVSVYLRRQEGQEDKSWRKVAPAVGV